MSKLLRANKWLILIILIGLVLRLYAITYGFPFIFSVDEPALVRSATGIRFNLNPKHFDWPHLHFYLTFFVFTLVYLIRGIFQVLSLQPFISSLFPLLWKDPLIFYFVARVFNAFLGTLTIIPVYLIGKKLFTEKVALFSALALCLFPYHVYNSHFALIDVPMTFWFTWSIYFSVLIMLEGKVKWYVLAGIFAGLSASTKYNGGFAVFIILLAHVLCLRREKLLNFTGLKSKFTKFLFISAFFSILAFFIGTPYALLDFKTFKRDDGPKGAFWQFENVGKVDSDKYFKQLVNVLTEKVNVDFGYSNLILFEIFILYFLFSKKSTEKVFITLPGVFYFLYITSFDKNRIHYYILTFPFICLMVGYLFDKLYELDLKSFFKDNRLFTSFTKLSLLTNKKLRFGVLFSLVFLPPLYFSLKYDYLLSQADTRNQAADFLEKNVPKDQLIVYSGRDLDVVMENSKNPTKRIKSMSFLSNYEQAKYLVVAINERLSDIDDYKVIKPYTELLYSAEDVNRFGPNVYIFSLNITK